MTEKVKKPRQRKKKDIAVGKSGSGGMAEQLNLQSQVPIQVRALSESDHEKRKLSTEDVLKRNSTGTAQLRQQGRREITVIKAQRLPTIHQPSTAGAYDQGFVANFVRFNSGK